jgi:protein phosphatase-4 regulatory subunit 3
LRFFRTCIGVKDEYYNRHFIKHDIFGPIITAFLETKEKYNLFNSACLELFEFIRKENIKSLIGYLYDKYETVLRGIDYVDTFKQLLLRHEQGLDGNNAGEQNAEVVTPVAKSVIKREEDKREDDYFAGSDDEESASPMSTGEDLGSPFPGFKKLVDYGEDEDELIVGGKRKSEDGIVTMEEDGKRQKTL